jgi:sulfatase maturation enzyme AslB (radical SAM superfamily)
MKTNLILHLTTSCNYDCSYCDVIKDQKNFSMQDLERILSFIKKNNNNIERFKFFG